MGYNGNNRGRTHKWSGVGDKRHYNWGLNITSKAIVAPFAIMAALIEMENSVSEDIGQQTETSFDSHNDLPISVLKSYENPKDKLHQLYRKVAFVKRDIRNIKRYIFFLKFNIFQIKKSIRKQKLLTYLIQRRERLIDTISLFDFGVGEAINPSAISGRVTIHNSPQNGDVLNLGCLCKKDTKIFHKYIETINTLSLRTRKWQIMFFTKAMFIESKRGFAIIPYEEIKWTKQEVINHGLTNTHGYEVCYQTWYHSRVDGGPDRRYKNNHPIYSIRRYQCSLNFLKSNRCVYFIFDSNSAAKDFGGIISQKASFQIAKEKVNLLSWNAQKKKKQREIILHILAGMIVLCASVILELLFNVPTWELWDGFLILPIIAVVGTLFIVTLPIGLMSWGLGFMHRYARKKPALIISMLSIVSIISAVFTYFMSIDFLEAVGAFNRYSILYHGELEIIRLVFWGIVSTTIGVLIHTRTAKQPDEE